MKRTLLNLTSLFILISSVAMLTVSCTEEEENIQAEVNVSASTLTLSRLGLNEEGNTATVDVISTVYWKLTVEQEQEWLSVSPLGGSGETTLTFTAVLNDSVSRTANVILETFDGLKKEIQVTQNSKEEIIYYLFEDMGKDGVQQTDVNFYDNWTKTGIGSLLTKYAGLNAAMVDTQEPSAGYAGASGGNNVLFTTEQSSVSWGPVGTRGDEYFNLSFGIYSPGVFVPADLKLYISKDGENWVPLSYTRSTTQSGWAKAESVYMVADIASVYYKLVSAKASYRVDDIVLLEDPLKSGAEVIFQTVIDDDKPAGYVYYTHDFSWITVETFGGTAANFPTNELGFTNSNITPEQKDTIDKYGWTQELGSTYLRPHIIKIGKTRVGSDIISPQFSFIAPFKSINLDVSFDVAIYASAGGTKDLDGIKVEVRNGGTVNSQVLTSYSTDVDVWINTGGELTEPMKRITVKIYGATSRTQLRIMSGVENSEQTRLNKSNRFFFDNFEVKKASNE